MKNYTPLNGNVIIKKIETGTLVVSGEEKDINAVLTGKVVGVPRMVETATELSMSDDFLDKEVQFIRGQSRQVKLDGEDYFLMQISNLLLVRNE